MQPPHRGRRWLRWALGFALVAVIVAIAGVVWKTTVDTSSAETKPQARRHGPRRTPTAWRDGDYDADVPAALAALASCDHVRGVQGRPSEQAAETTTLKRISSVGATQVRRGIATTPVVANTREFGHVHQTLSLRLVPVPAGFRVLWGPQLVFPGLKPGEHAAGAYPRAVCARRDPGPRRRGAGERPRVQPRVSARGRRSRM